MTRQLLRGLLRAIAVTIAVVALIDPVVTMQRDEVAPLVLINMADGDVSAIANELGRQDPSTEIEVRTVANRRLPCRDEERCVVVADGSVSAQLPADLATPLSLVRTGDRGGVNVGLRAVTVSTAQHAGAAGVAQVVVDGRNVAGRRTSVQITDRNAIVGTAALDWKSDGSQTIAVPWWPLGTGPRSLRVEAVTDGGDSVHYDNVIDVGVDVGSERMPVLVFDARPSWSSTFVRRALEDDRRFLVEHRARLAPALTAGTANGRLDAGALDAAAVLIVGGPDALTAAEVDLIDQFVQVRGGTAVLLPERVPAGAAARIMPGEWTEQLTAEAQSVGPLLASELLVYPPNDEHHDVLALAGARPAIVAVPSNAGRVIVSGAMDAWRYRDADDGAFDRFWRSVVAEGAAAGARLQLEFEQPITAPGARARFTVRYRSMTPASTFEASAVANCDRAQAIRLWPAGPPGVLHGEMPVDQDACTVEAAVNNVRASRGIAVSETLSRPVDDTLGAIEQFARESGGVVTDGDNLNAIATRPAQSPVPTPVRPMRSTWWMLPFAACLSIEWWLRRRVGLR